MSVIELEVAAMQRRYRRCQAQSKTGTGLGSARLQPDKSLHRMLAVGHRNARSVVGDAEQHPIAVAPGLDQDLLLVDGSSRTAAGQRRGGNRLAIFDRVLDQIRQRLADQFAVAAKLRRTPP